MGETRDGDGAAESAGTRYISSIHEANDWMPVARGSIPASRLKTIAMTDPGAGLSCSDDEIRRDAATVAKVLAGLRLAAERQATYGLDLAKNSHAIAARFGEAWRFADELKSRGLELGRRLVPALLNLPDALDEAGRREAQETYIDLIPCLLTIEGASAPVGMLPAITHEFLAEFADVARRLEKLAVTLEIGRQPEKNPPRPAQTEGRPARRGKGGKKRDGSVGERVKGYLKALIASHTEMLGEGLDLPKQQNRKDIAAQLKVSQATVSRSGSELYKTYENLFIRRVPKGIKSRNGDIEAIDG